MDNIRIAMAKGRLAKQAVKLFRAADINIPEDMLSSRKLIFSLPEENLEIVLVKPADVPIYVEYGTADLGIVGKDTLLEENRDLYEVLDLQFGKCRFALAGLPGKKESLLQRKVATKYPDFTRRYFRSKGEPVEIIKLNGSIELAPLTGLADTILDIVQTGRTLKENGLVVYENIRQLSARLVVNKVSMKTSQVEITKIIDALENEVEGG
ncbi:MAG TPA: ATP phosphoribosyltransferase [Halanaerobiales bacterium]|nr:ATP phosphoribosyltransferase [Halanaerobiales bacterium]